MAHTHDMEAAILAMLSQTSALAVVISQLESFKATHGHRPEIISINSSVRMAFTVDLIRILQLHPQEAIQTPIYFDGVPIVYSDSMGEYYLQLTNRRIKAIFLL